jgi:hypothetical protein
LKETTIAIPGNAGELQLETESSGPAAVRQPPGWRENARQAGGKDGDQYWSALVGEVDEMIWQAVHAGFAYFPREAGRARRRSAPAINPGAKDHAKRDTTSIQPPPTRLAYQAAKG